MGLFGNLFGGKPQKMAVQNDYDEEKVERMAATNDFDGIVSMMLTNQNSDIARKAGNVFRKMVWNTLCMGDGWEGLFSLGIDIAAKIIANPPLDNDRAEYAYLVYDQGFTREVPIDYVKKHPVTFELLKGVQQAILKLYLDGGEYFHDRLSNNALGNVPSNRLYPLYLQELYVQILQEGNPLKYVISRCKSYLDGESFWCIYDYINKKRENLLEKDKELILSTDWYKLPDFPYFFSIEAVKKIYLYGVSDDTGFIPYFEKQYIKNLEIGN